MKRCARSLSVALLLVFAAGTAGPAQDGEVSGSPQENIVLISWDGVQRNHLVELLEAERLPTLQRFIDTGSYVELIVEGKTDTKAGHARMLTGYCAEVTGVHSNGDYNPIPEGFTILERLENHYGRDNIHTIMLAGKKGNVGASGPRYGYASKKARKRGLPQRYLPAEPYFISQNGMDVYDVGHREATVVGPRALEFLDTCGQELFFAFFHFSDPDHTGHRHGENSEQYSEAIVTCDMWLETIVTKLEELGVRERTRIFITTDHGFDEGNAAGEGSIAAGAAEAPWG